MWELLARAQQLCERGQSACAACLVRRSAACASAPAERRMHAEPPPLQHRAARAAAAPAASQVWHWRTIPAQQPPAVCAMLCTPPMGSHHESRPPPHCRPGRSGWPASAGCRRSCRAAWGGWPLAPCPGAGGAPSAGGTGKPLCVLETLRATGVLKASWRHAGGRRAGAQAPWHSGMCKSAAQRLPCRAAPAACPAAAHVWPARHCSSSSRDVRMHGRLSQPGSRLSRARPPLLARQQAQAGPQAWLPQLRAAAWPAQAFPWVRGSWCAQTPAAAQPTQAPTPAQAAPSSIMQRHGCKAAAAGTVLVRPSQLWRCKSAGSRCAPLWQRVVCTAMRQLAHKVTVGCRLARASLAGCQPGERMLPP